MKTGLDTSGVLWHDIGYVVGQATSDCDSAGSRRRDDPGGPRLRSDKEENGKAWLWCWAHWKREFRALIDRGNPQAKRLGYDLRRMTCKRFEHGGNYRDGTIRRAAFVRRMAPVRREVDRLPLRGAESGNKSLVGTCRELYGHRDWRWRFVRCDGIEPTNHAGERALRHAVIWRKLSFGTQSAAGSRFVETMLTVIETCRQQHRNTFEYLTIAVKVRLAGQPAPSLLPGV